MSNHSGWQISEIWNHILYMPSEKEEEGQLPKI